MKEKIGIEKLIELLNEYENKDLELEEGEESNARTENNGHLWFNGANKVQFDTYMFDNLALSKRYGFIGWLVENDKIDNIAECWYWRNHFELDEIEYNQTDFQYWVLESSLKDENELEQFLLDNIKVEG